jgi:hypothetical protein
MGDVQTLFGDYKRLRSDGQEVKTVLQSLRSRVEALNQAQREELTQLVRAWESNGRTTDAQSTKPVRQVAIKRLAPKPQPAAAVTMTQAVPVAPPATDEWITCPTCGKANRQKEVFCFSCGGLLGPVQSANDTRHFSQADNAIGAEYFGPKTVLVLRLRGTPTTYEILPQQADHELVIGRSAQGSVMMPDVDLADQKGAELGVSRLHMSLHYDPSQEAVLVVDMNSANGSFINGQKLLPKEVRVLRHGDELRLGKLVLVVSFRHPAS